MRTHKSSPLVPHYHGKSWLTSRLPRKVLDWSACGPKSFATDSTEPRELGEILDLLNKNKMWKFPKKKHFFFSDLHGDPQAFAASLVASGGVKKTGPISTDFTLSHGGQKAHFVIGGDCFDKGPSSLGLLRTIKHLCDLGAHVHILAGNHDVRVLFGMLAVGKKKETRNEHFFIRTGQKIIPLLKEVWDSYLEHHQDDIKLLSPKKAYARLYPREDWFEKFPDIALDLNQHQVHRELERISKKIETFERKCEKAGLSLPMVLAAVEKWKDLFLTENGEFYWYFDKMDLVYKSGSFLFVHAGLDNTMAQKLVNGGIGDMNATFHSALYQDPYDFYYGPLCNMVRTKYRNVDHPFTRKGARHLRRAGISAVIHGHRNLHHGQRIALRKSILNFECDTSLDSHTRKHEKVRGTGAAVTIIHPKGKILGVSSDYSHIKVFDPVKTCKNLKNESTSHEKR